MLEKGSPNFPRSEYDLLIWKTIMKFVKYSCENSGFIVSELVVGCGGQDRNKNATSDFFYLSRSEHIGTCFRDIYSHFNCGFLWIQKKTASICQHNFPCAKKGRD